MEFRSSDLRLEIFRFMVACEEFLAFVQMNGGPSRLTHEERRRILTYQKIITALMSEEAHASKEEFKPAA